MSRPLRIFLRFWEDEDGATMVEYALMVALIAIALVASVLIVGQSLEVVFGKVATELASGS